MFLTWLYLRFTYFVRKKKYAHGYYNREYKNNHLKPPGLPLKNMKKRFKKKKPAILPHVHCKQIVFDT